MWKNHQQLRWAFPAYKLSYLCYFVACTLLLVLYSSSLGFGWQHELADGNPTLERLIHLTTFTKYSKLTALVCGWPLGGGGGGDYRLCGEVNLLDSHFHHFQIRTGHPIAIAHQHQSAP